MKNLTATKDGATLEFKYRGICKYGGLAPEYLHEKVLNADIIHPKCNTGKVIFYKGSDPAPSVKKLLIVSARYEELGLRHLGDYEKIPQQKYDTIVGRALGVEVTLRGKRYKVVHCPDDFGPYFALSYRKLCHREMEEDPYSETRINMMATKRKEGIERYGDTTFIVTDRGDKLSPRLGLSTNSNQPWSPLRDFVFCLEPIE